MLKLKRYLKPYLAYLLAAVVLLFGQAMLELTLPNMMSDIVNVGLQQGGVTDKAPRAVSAEAMALMQTFMTDADRAAVDAAYTPVSSLGSGEAADLLAEFPAAGADALALTAEGEEKSAADGAFARADYALVQALEALAEAGGQSAAGAVGESGDAAGGASLDVGRLAQLAPAFAAAPDAVNEAVRTAAATPDMMLEQTAAVFAKSFYAQLGADTDAMQTGYILRVGAGMLGLAVLLTACAVGAGFCLARMGAGVGRDLRRDVFARVTYFNSAEMDRFSTASLITRSTNDVQQVQMFLSMGLRMMCFAPIMGIGGLVMGLSKCISLAWVLALALVLMLGLILVLFAVALPRFKRCKSWWIS